jgi:hypothetical protein
MSEGGVLAAIGACIALCLWASFALIEADRPHEDCVEARRIEIIVGKPARHCPPIAGWRENWSHTDADHD